MTYLATVVGSDPEFVFELFDGLLEGLVALPEIQLVLDGPGVLDAEAANLLLWLIQQLCVLARLRLYLLLLQIVVPNLLLCFVELIAKLAKFGFESLVGHLVDLVEGPTPGT